MQEIDEQNLDETIVEGKMKWQSVHKKNWKER